MGGNIYNMKNVVEGLKKTSNKEVAKDKTYWFPLSKGFNRLLVVVNCLILVYAVNKYSEKFNTFFFTIFIELVVYIHQYCIFHNLFNQKENSYYLSSFSFKGSLKPR